MIVSACLFPRFAPLPDPMFSFFKKKSQDPAASTTTTPAATPAPSASPPLPKKSWLASLRSGLSRTSSSITTLFVGAKIDDDLFDELESALLMADAGVEATAFLLEGLKKKVKADKQSLETLTG